MLIKVFHILFAAWMILASGGIALFEHICHCSGDTDITLSSAHRCHGEQAMETDCCVVERPCCSLSEADGQACGLSKEKGCCETERLAFLKTDVFTPASWAKAKLIPEYELAVVDRTSCPLLLPEKQEPILIPAHGPPLLPDSRYFLLHSTAAFHSTLS
ncbi:MAG TPA: hypothetical protein P5550_07660 [Bacteroidales bacterium]|nr:hypothetical protein [Bacteroidales bacterium]